MEILLIGAVACMAALILSAWLMTFARWFPVKGLDEKIPDYKSTCRLRAYGIIQFRFLWFRC